MAFSRVTKIGDGASTQFVVNFALDYLDRGHVTARVGTEVDGLGAPVYRDITFLSTNLLQIAGAPAGIGIKILFERTVPKDELIVNYSNGDVLDEENLDVSQKQTLMAVQEVLDGRFATLTQDLDFGGFKGINVAEPVANTDTATKGYVDGRVGNLAGIVEEITIVASIKDEVEIVAGVADDVSAVAEVADAVAIVAANASILSGTASALYMDEDVFTGDGVETSWTLSTAPVSEANVDVWVGGSIQPLSAYSLVGSTLVISPAVANGVQILAKTRVQVSANTVEVLVDQAEAAKVAAEAARDEAQAIADELESPSVGGATDVSTTLRASGKGLFWDGTAGLHKYSWASPLDCILDLRDLMDEYYGVGVWTMRTGPSTGSNITPALEAGCDRLRSRYAYGTIRIPPGLWLCTTSPNPAKLAGISLVGTDTSGTCLIVFSGTGNMLSYTGTGGYGSARIEHLGLFREQSTSGGVGILVQGDATSQPGQFQIDDIYMSVLGSGGTLGRWAINLLIDGTAKTTGAHGVRVFDMKNLQLFCAGAGNAYSAGIFNGLQGNIINLGTYGGTGTLANNMYIGGNGSPTSNSAQLFLARLIIGGMFSMLQSSDVYVDGACTSSQSDTTATYYRGYLRTGSHSGLIGTGSELLLRT